MAMHVSDNDFMADPHRVAEMLLRLQDEGVLPPMRIETIADDIVMQAASRWENNFIAQQVGVHLNAAGLWVLSGTDLVTPDGSELIPDILAVESAPAPASKPVGRETAFVAEVVSESNWRRDYHDKHELYAWSGVPEYLIIDPRDGTIVRHRRPDADSRRWHEIADYAFGDEVPLLCTVEPMPTVRFPRYR
jgi:Uma2 family endonuclease